MAIQIDSMCSRGKKYSAFLLSIVPTTLPLAKLFERLRAFADLRRATAKPVVGGGGLLHPLWV
jgi:hypothetical protein